MKRHSGVLLSITSLPSKYGIGCFDQAAYDFVDFLAEAGQKYWQILPLGATSHGGAYDSPYQAYSAFAGNPYFISLDALIEEKVLTKRECDAVDFGTDPGHVDYEKMYNGRFALLHKAYERSAIYADPEFQKFVADNHWWLDDYALFMAVREFFGNQNWKQWPEDIRMRYGYALDYYREKLYFDVEFHKYLQFQFYRQWKKLKNYANRKGIQIVGDIPIYVSPDGSDIWAHPEMFQLDENNESTQIAGCPPDAFSEDGQVWGNPLYRWDYHKATGYNWWISRMWYSFRLYDVVRIDHFRGFDQYFSIPAETGKAADGHWEDGPGMELFRVIKENLGEEGVIVEDLGLLTDSVRKLVKQTGYPNMKVLQFAFDEGDEAGANDYLPHNYCNNCVVYTGTHDNETLAGWFAGLSKEKKEQVRTYLGDFDTANKWMYKKIIQLAMMSAADTCIIPIQDWLGLDNTARMNVPGTVDINWSWRLRNGQIPEDLAQQMLAVTKRYGRTNWDGLMSLEKKSKDETAEEE